MSSSAVAPLMAASRAFLDDFTLRLRGYRAFPTGAEGTTRLVGSIGLGAARGGVGARVEAHVPFVGEPFSSKLVLELSMAL